MSYINALFQRPNLNRLKVKWSNSQTYESFLSTRNQKLLSEMWKLWYKACVFLRYLNSSNLPEDMSFSDTTIRSTETLKWHIYCSLSSSVYCRLNWLYTSYIFWVLLKIDMVNQCINKSYGHNIHSAKLLYFTPLVHGMIFTLQNEKSLICSLSQHWTI